MSRTGRFPLTLGREITKFPKKERQAKISLTWSERHTMALSFLNSSAFIRDHRYRRLTRIKRYSVNEEYWFDTRPSIREPMVDSILLKANFNDPMRNVHKTTQIISFLTKISARLQYIERMSMTRPYCEVEYDYSISITPSNYFRRNLCKLPKSVRKT